MKRLFVAHIAISIIVATGCGQSSAPGTKTTSAESKTTASKDGKQVALKAFSITLPKHWEVVDLTNKELMASTESAWMKDPKMAALVPQVKSAAANGSIKVMAFDMSSASGGFVSNFNAVVLDQVAIPLEQLAEANKDQLKTLASGDIEERKVKGKNCDLVLFKWKMKNTSGDIGLYTAVAIKGTRNYTFTFTSLAKNMEGLATTVDSAIASLEIK